jgi:hypothetical protein
MITIIEDGHGTGNKARVDDHGRVVVRSNMVSHMSHHASSHKNLFSLPLSTVLADGSETAVAFIKNTSPTEDMEFHIINIAADANVAYKIYVGDSYSAGGTPIIPLNTNIGTGTALVGSFYAGGASANLTVVTTLRDTLCHGYVQAYGDGIIRVDGGIILPPSKTMTVTATGAASDNILVNFYLTTHVAGTML